MVSKSSKHCRTDISQPYSDNFCWHFRWAQEKLGDTQFHPRQKCSRCKVSVCSCHEFGRRWFFSWHNILINYFAYISSILFFVFEIVFSHSLQRMQKCRLSFPTPRVGSSMASYHQKPFGSWTHWILYIWTMLYFVSNHSFENPPLVSQYSLCKTFVLTNFDFWVSVIYVTEKIALLWIYCWKWKPEHCLLLRTKFKL